MSAVVQVASFVISFFLRVVCGVIAIVFILVPTFAPSTVSVQAVATTAKTTPAKTTVKSTVKKSTKTPTKASTKTTAKSTAKKAPVNPADNPDLTASLATATAAPAVCNDPGSDEVRQACSDFAKETQALKELQRQLLGQKSKSGSLQQNVNELVGQIVSTQTKIRNQIGQINTLTQQIHQKVQVIGDLSSELDRQRTSMAQVIRRTDDIDRRGPAFILLGSESVSGLYQDVDDFFSIKQSLSSVLNRVKKIKSVTETQKAQLQTKQFQALDAKNSLESEKNKLAQSQKQVQDLLNTSKSEEQRQAAMIVDQQKKVASIQSKLFSFAGGNTAAIKFKDAYAYATEASAATGVRAAFILAILTQESNLGKNVGTCNRKGDPISKSWKNIMNPTRDQEPFKRIVNALGLDVDTTPVSCPIKGGGWGGAMGPAQFIPSTWERVAPKVATALGKSSANPWIARDAIMASATYLKAIGATSDESSERNAACRYYSGRTCDNRSPKNSFYGNNVVSLARRIQTDIDYLNQYGVSRR